MAGVAGPLLIRRRADGVRLLIGLTVGSLLSGLLVALVLALLGRLAQFLPAQFRLVLLVGICLALGLADIANRTPHVWRQVPQILIHQLTPGLRGLAWGVDLGLLVTTQKAASLVWATLAAVVLLNPGVAPAMLLGMALVSCLSVAVWSARFAPRLRKYESTSDHGITRDRIWLRSIRISSGLVLLAMAGMTATAAV
jgi:hypothetical protein